MPDLADLSDLAILYTYGKTRVVVETEMQLFHYVCKNLLIILVNWGWFAMGKTITRFLCSKP